MEDCTRSWTIRRRRTKDEGRMQRHTARFQCLSIVQPLFDFSISRASPNRRDSFICHSRATPNLAALAVVDGPNAPRPGVNPYEW